MYWRCRCRSMWWQVQKLISVFDFYCFVFFFRLLIGAPRARALGKQTASITGGIYKCEITQSNDCERVEFDNEGELSIYLSVSLSRHSDIQTVSKGQEWISVLISLSCVANFWKRMYSLRTRRISGWGWRFRARDLGERLWWVKLRACTTVHTCCEGVNLNWAVSCIFRLVLTAIRGACLWTPLRSPGTSPGAAMSWVRTWPSTSPLTRTGVTGTSVRAEPEAMRCLDLASRVCQPPSPRTTITWCLEHQELTTGKVPNYTYTCFTVLTVRIEFLILLKQIVLFCLLILTWTFLVSAC